MALAARVRSVLAADPLVSSLRISVEVSRGVVSVTGGVGTAREKERILEDVRAVPGVKEVNDLLAAPPLSRDAPAPVSPFLAPHHRGRCLGGRNDLSDRHPRPLQSDAPPR